MTKNVRMIGLGLLSLLYFAYPMYLLYRKHTTIKFGERVVFSTPAYPPQSSYQGQFLYIDLPQQGDFSENVRRGDYLYVRFDAEGKLLDISRKRPNTDGYVKVRARHQEGNTVFLDYPFTLRTVFPESPIPDSAVQQWTRVEQLDKSDTPRIQVEAYLYKGRGRTTKILPTDE